MLPTPIAVIAEMLNYYETLLSPQAWSNLFVKPRQEKSPSSSSSLVFESVEISNFKGVTSANIIMKQNALTLLLGLNESGKTTVLKAVEAFDFRNDPKQDIKKFFASLRNRDAITSNDSVRITSNISIASPLDVARYAKDLKSAAKWEKNNGATGVSINEDIPALKDFIALANRDKGLTISRVIPFNEGSPARSYYELNAPKHPFIKTRAARLIAQAIVRDCPQIFYFEDFQDMIPPKIFAHSRSPGYNSTWYEIIDGLFYSADPNFSIDQFVRFHGKDSSRKMDAKSVLAKVNNVLNQRFTQKWHKLSGVEGIGHAEIQYEHAGRGGNFELNIYDKAGTVYTVSERSKGAIWYLGFLMKAEFRRKKLRSDTGKSIYLIDEPASNLHPTAQRSMLEDFKKMLEDASVIYTTHSQHLVSLENLRTTYVAQRHDGKISCVRWGDYIQKKSAKVTYYQPLADCLDIGLSHLEFGWKKALIVEGLSDRHVLLLMHNILYGKNPDFVVYVAGSATNMYSLISLNMGWGAKFRILLDSDGEGTNAAKKYCETFSLNEGEDVILHPEQTDEIEKYFSQKERLALRKIAQGESGNGSEKVEKKEFMAIISLLLQSDRNKDVKHALKKETIDKFRGLFQKIGLD